jgi:hypothetical protein
MRLPLAYLFLRDGSDESLHMAPPWSARVRGTPDHFTVTFQRAARPALTLEARGREYGEFGARIVNTLVGDLEIREGASVIAACRGTAGLERRFPS